MGEAMISWFKRPDVEWRAEIKPDSSIPGVWDYRIFDHRGKKVKNHYVILGVRGEEAEREAERQVLGIMQEAKADYEKKSNPTYTEWKQL